MSTHPEPLQALQKVLSDTTQQPSFSMLFVGTYHAWAFTDLVEALHRATEKVPSLAVVGAGVVGEGRELDEPSTPSLSLLCAYGLPADDLQLFSFNALTEPPPSPESKDWNDLFHTTDNDESMDNAVLPSVFIVGDPWSPLDDLLSLLSHAIVMGGISVPTGTGPTVGMNGQSQPQGSLVGWRLPRQLQLQVVTAQGCRPATASSYEITDCHTNAILELNHRPALDVLQELIQKVASDDERRKLSSGLVVALPVTQGAQNDNPTAIQDTDDYLIRQIAGFIPQKNGILIAAGGRRLQKGNYMRFFVRDQEAAREDLELMVHRAQAAQLVFGRSRPVAALQVSCVARGRSLFGGAPNVDIDMYQELLGCADGSGQVPVGGFYANGEIGGAGLVGFERSPTGRVNDEPLGTYVHGFTTVIGLICYMSRDKDDPVSDLVVGERKGTPLNPGIVSSADGAAESWG